MNVCVCVFVLYLSFCSNKTAQHDKMPLSQQSGKRPLQIYYAITTYTYTNSHSLFLTHSLSHTHTHLVRGGRKKKKVVMAQCPSKDG